MKRHILTAVVVAWTMGGVSLPQLGAVGAPIEQHPEGDRVAEGSPATSDSRKSPASKHLEKASKSLEKAGEEIGEALEKTGDAAREALGMTKQGCLRQGDETDPYLLEEGDTGKQVTVVGSPELAAHINHLVKLDGREEAEGRVFHVTKVEQIASTCAPQGQDETIHANRPPGELTVQDQGTSTADRKMTQSIRQALAQDKTLSIHAKNIKIITRDGFVTLKGLADNEEEKRTIEAKAIGVAGAGKVSNELVVRAGNPTQERVLERKD